MKHQLPWTAVKAKDGFFHVADAHGERVVTVGNEAEDGQTAEMIAACVNMSGITWMIFRHAVQVPHLMMQLHGEMAKHVTSQADDVKAVLDDCLEDELEPDEDVDDEPSDT